MEKIVARQHVAVNGKGRKVCGSWRKVSLLLALAATSLTAGAQDKVEPTIGLDMVSNYVWRGRKLDDLALQPTLGVSYKGVSLTAWGSYGITGRSSVTKEFDLTLAYNVGKLNVGITDYFVTSDDNAKYFLYKSCCTAHTFEGNVGYDFGFLSVQWFTNFAGSDGRTEKGKRAFTSYVELNAPFSVIGIDWDATLAAVPYSAGNGFYAANAHNFAITNIALKATKEIKITDKFSLPIFAKIIANPSTQKAYFVAGFTLQP